MSDTETKTFNRRQAISLTAGSSILVLGANQAFAAGLLGNIGGGLLGGGAGKGADWSTLAKEASKAIGVMAKQTSTLLKVQESYCSVIGLKKEAAAVQKVINDIKSGNVNQNDVGAVEKITKNTEKAVSKALSKKITLDAGQKKKLVDGLATHKKAIQDMWVGVIMVVKVLADAKSAKKPSLTDVDALKSFKQITKDLPVAIKFGKTSKQTFKSYAESFEYKAKIPLSAKQKDLPLKDIS